MAVLDSSFLIDLFRKKPSAVALLDTFESHEVFVPSVAFMEIWFGALHRLKECEQVHDFMSGVHVLSFSMGVARRAAEIDFDLERRGLTISTEDIMIAAHALELGDALVTRNEHFTQISGLRVLKY